MPKYSAKQRKLRGQGKTGGPAFFQLPNYVKLSRSYHGIGPIARALLIEIGSRYNGNNNGMISLGVREAAYEIGCSQSSISRAARELDDGDLARPMKVGAWRGKQATEWRITWKITDDSERILPRNNWAERTPHHQLLLPKPKKEPLSDAERARRYRLRRHEDRHGEFRQESAQVPPEVHRRDASSATRAQNGNSSITSRNPSSTTGAHIDIYHTQGRYAGAGVTDTGGSD